ncbi:MAG: Uma2 family endonuclease [Planctomycetaceae bacterium]
MSRTILNLTHENDRLPVTREEFAEAEFEEPWRYERAQGRLVVMPPPGWDHQHVTCWFRNHLGAYMLDHPDLVEEVFQECWAAIDELTDRIPDIAVYLKSSADQSKSPERTPDLIFETVSAGAAARRRDYEEKREDYRRFGVREYVIIDRLEHRLTVLRLADGEYVESTLGVDETYTSPLLPGLAIPLAGVI